MGGWEVDRGRQWSSVVVLQFYAPSELAALAAAKASVGGGRLTGVVSGRATVLCRIRIDGFG